MLEPDPELEAFAIVHKQQFKRKKPIPSVCEECGEQLFSKTQLADHLRTQHPTEPVFNDAKRDEFLKLLKAGTRFFKGCKAVKIAPETVKRAMKVDPTFAEAVSLAEEEAAERAEELLWEQAEAGNMTAIVRILEKRQKARWSNEQIINVQVSGEITHRPELMAHQNRILELQARAKERMALNGTSELDEIVDAEIVE